MNENTIELVGDADTVATLRAANNGLPTGDAGDGETAQPEAEKQEAVTDHIPF